MARGRGSGKFVVIVAWSVGLLATLVAAGVESRDGSGTCGFADEETPSATTTETPSSEAASETGANATDLPTRSPEATNGGRAEGTADSSDTDAAQLPPALPTLEPLGDQPVRVALGRSRDVRVGQARFTVVPPARESTDGDAERDSDAIGELPSGIAGDRSGTVLSTHIGPFVRDDGAPLAGPSAITATSGSDEEQSGRLIAAHALSRREVVTVALCVDREAGDAVADPGTYVGSVTITDPRITRTEVPFIVTMSYPNPFALLSLLVVVAALAAMYVWLLHTGKPTDESIDMGAFVDWLGTRTGVLAVGSGIVAVYVAYSAAYLADAAWGASIVQLAALVGAAFTAFITAAATVISAAATSSKRVPEVAGQPMEEAHSRLEDEGLTSVVMREGSETVAADRVIRTVPSSSAHVPANTQITLIVSSGPEHPAGA